jgi:hypothetical protein
VGLVALLAPYPCSACKQVPARNTRVVTTLMYVYFDLYRFADLLMFVLQCNRTQADSGVKCTSFRWNLGSPWLLPVPTGPNTIPDYSHLSYSACDIDETIANVIPGTLPDISDFLTNTGGHNRADLISAPCGHQCTTHLPLVLLVLVKADAIHAVGVGTRKDTATWVVCGSTSGEVPMAILAVWTSTRTRQLQTCGTG